MLGWNVKDKITGFSGRVLGYVRYLTGCNQCLVSPPVDEKGAFQEPHWFDEQRLERIDDSVLTLDNGATPGCDIPAPKR
jgi:hypothetical protein